MPPAQHTAAPATELPTLTTTAGLPAKPDKKRAPQVTGKLKRALDLMVFGDGETEKTYDHITAPRAVGFNCASMRKALDRPHVQRYLREAKQVFRQSVSGANILVLKRIRDDSGNSMARLGSIKLLEQLDERAPTSQATQRNVQPGVVVIVNANPGPGVMTHQGIIEVNPLQSNDDVPADE